jgi:phosphoribosylformylglycinamidine cyclo-ligase
MSDDSAYTAAGVDISAGQRATELMKAAIRTTYSPAVLSDTGAFGGLFDLSQIKNTANPVLVASTDGVGTKTMVAAHMNRWDTIGQDLVNHCVNDILVQGARPLFFLDYVASSKLDPEQIAAVVSGCATACRQVNCALLGGETAEMPGVYQPGEIDLAGTIIGVVERERIIDGSHIQPGDMIIGLPSTGLHTNGFSLARHALADLDWTEPNPALGGSVGDALLAVHRCYLGEIRRLLDAGVAIRGLAHITGGGFVDNLPRILPDGLGANIQRGTWPELPVFGLIQRLADVPSSEMFRVFNMGIGMLIVLPQASADLARTILPDESYILGEIVAGQSGVKIQEG